MAVAALAFCMAALPLQRYRNAPIPACGLFNLLVHTGLMGDLPHEQPLRPAGGAGDLARQATKPRNPAHRVHNAARSASTPRPTPTARTQLSGTHTAEWHARS